MAVIGCLPLRSGRRCGRAAAAPAFSGPPRGRPPQRSVQRWHQHPRGMQPPWRPRMGPAPAGATTALHPPAEAGLPEEPGRLPPVDGNARARPPQHEPPPGTACRNARKVARRRTAAKGRKRTSHRLSIDSDLGADHCSGQAASGCCSAGRARRTRREDVGDSAMEWGGAARRAWCGRCRRISGTGRGAAPRAPPRHAS